jgi:hypothetical protein
MSAQAEEFARQLLERTLAGKLKWQFVSDPEDEVYKYDADDELSFSVKRKARGDDKVVTMELTKPGRIVLTDSENNFVDPSNSALVREQAMSFILSRRVESPLSMPNEAKIKRFRLYSDLFYAARQTAEGREEDKDEAIEKAQQFLARLA